MTAVSLGWLAGRWSHAVGLGQVLGHSISFSVAAIAPEAGRTETREPNLRGDTLSGGEDAPAQKALPRARDGRFADMPSVENIRAQARAIRDAERVWDAGEANEKIRLDVPQSRPSCIPVQDAVNTEPQARVLMQRD